MASTEGTDQKSVIPSELKLFNDEAEKKNVNKIKNNLGASALFWEHSCHKCDITKSDRAQDKCIEV